MRWRVVLVTAYFLGPLSAAQTPSETDTILTRIRRQMAENLARLPNYTCVETIDRSERLELAREFQPFDRLYLEVAEASGNELFARPGASQFEDKHPSEFAGWGAAGTGDFSLYARSVFVNDRATFRYRGAEDYEGRPANRYDYDVSAAASGFRVVRYGEMAVVPFHGSFWADAETFDLIRLDVVADQIPRKLDMALLSTQIVYAKFQIGDAGFLLAQSSTMRLSHYSGGEQRNQTEFTHCRQYAGSATVFFEGSSGSSETASIAELIIPADMHIQIELSRPINLSSARAGDTLLGTVSAAVVSHGRVIIPAGAAVAGRLRGLRRPGGRTVVMLEFSEVRFQGAHARFFAAIERVHSRRVSVKLVEPRGLLGIAAVVVDQASVVPEHGLQMTWKTLNIGDR